MKWLINEPLLLDKTLESFVLKESLLDVPTNDVGLFNLRTIPEQPLKSKFTWLLDNGHGGMIKGVYQTTGKRSPYLEDERIVYEGVFNRIIVKKIIDKCNMYGIRCINLVDTEVDTSLGSRIFQANNLHKKLKNCLYISVHANAHEEKNNIGKFTSAHGIETLYYQDPNDLKNFSKEGKKLATVFQQNIVKNAKRRDRGIKGRNCYILRNSTMPTIITENGFMTHLEEAQLLLDEDYQDKIVQGHFDAILEMELIGVIK